MKVCVIGCGFIGSTLINTMEEMQEIERIYVTDKSKKRASAFSRYKNVEYHKNVKEILDQVDLVIEAASQEAVHEYAPLVLKKGVDIFIMSVGALANDELREECAAIAKRNKCRLFIPTGAICGVDGLSAASVGKVESVTLTSTKSVRAFEDNKYLNEKGIDLRNLKSTEVVFEGNAREAVAKFPKTSNVAATLSLAGIGFDRTRVKIVADPSTKRNTHEVHVKGEFGELNAVISNVPSPMNPKTSILAALSPISGLKKLTGFVWIGL